MDKQTAEQFAEIWKILKENAELSRQTRQTLDELAVQSKDTDRKLAELAEESRQTRRTLDELAEQSKETDRKLAELAEMSKGTRRELDELAAQSKETARYMKESNRRLEGLGLVQGEIAEELFYRTIKEAMAKQGIIIDEVLSSLEVKGIGEYDIVAVNSTSAFVFEIKNKLKMDHLEKLHKVQLPRFREAFPEYKDHKLYAGVGALVVKEHIEKQARKLGFYVLTQGGKDNTVLHKPSSPRIF